MSALLLLTHTLTHNRKAAGGFSGLFSKSNRHFPSHAAPIGLEITLFFLQGDFGTKRPWVQVPSLRPCERDPFFEHFYRKAGLVLSLVSVFYSISLISENLGVIRKTKNLARKNLSYTIF